MKTCPDCKTPLSEKVGRPHCDMCLAFKDGYPAFEKGSQTKYLTSEKIAKLNKKPEPPKLEAMLDSYLTPTINTENPRYKLWQFFAREHNLILLDSELEDIIEAAEPCVHERTFAAIEQAETSIGKAILIACISTAAILITIKLATYLPAWAYDFPIIR
jgi:uncharacterized Zn finger protein (UPF0148 family)